MGLIKINNIIYGSNNASDIIYKEMTVEEKLDTIPILDINDNGNVDNSDSDVLTYGHIVNSLNSDAVDKTLSAKQGKVLKNYIDNLDTKITNFQNTFLNLVYPIGAIYLSLNNTNPGTLFGGTWEQIKDRFLLGAGDNYSIGETGGEATHTLTINEMPSHKHNMTRQQWYFNDTIYSTSTGTIFSWKSSSGGTSSAGYRGHDMDTAGGGAAHNNMPPYLTVYMWKRIS